MEAGKGRREGSRWRQWGKGMRRQQGKRGGEEACDKMKRKLCEEVTRHPKDECMLTQPLSQHTLSTLTTSLTAISKVQLKYSQNDSTH